MYPIVFFFPHILADGNPVNAVRTRQVSVAGESHVDSGIWSVLFSLCC
jgi:hypothetical protein